MNGPLSNPSSHEVGIHVVFGSGGTRAVLAGLGAAAGISLLGLHHRCARIGGVSGGAIPALLLAANFPVKRLLCTAHTDFLSLLTPKTGKLRRYLAALLKYRYELTLPKQGVYNPEALALFIDRLVHKFPERFWTLATSSEGHALFDINGINIFTPGAGLGKSISTVPPPLGTSVCASLALPGIVDAVALERHHWYDSAIRESGQCPTDVPRLLWGARPPEIIAFDVGEDSVKKHAFLRAIWRLLSNRPIWGDHPDGSDGTLIIRPPEETFSFHSLEMNLHPLVKWRAIIGGLSATVAALHDKHGIQEPQQAQILALTRHLDELVRRQDLKEIERTIQEL